MSFGEVFLPEEFGVGADAHETKLIAGPVENQKQIGPDMTFENIGIFALQCVKVAARRQWDIMAKPFNDFGQCFAICMAMLKGFEVFPETRVINELPRFSPRHQRVLLCCQP